MKKIYYSQEAAEAIVKKALRGLFDKDIDLCLNSRTTIYKIYCSFSSKTKSMSYYYSFKKGEDRYRSKIFDSCNDPFEKGLKSLSGFEQALLKKIIKISPTVSSEGISIAAPQQGQKRKENEDGRFRGLRK